MIKCVRAFGLDKETRALGFVPLRHYNRAAV